MMTKKWRRRWEAFGEKLTFIFAPPIVLLIRLVPLSCVYLLGRGMARVADIFPGRRKKIALANLRLVFGTRKSEQELEAMYKQCLTRTVTSFLESMKLCFLPPAVVKERIKIRELSLPVSIWGIFPCSLPNWLSKVILSQ
jgi:lauroyl/myristoyl acyltransferase